MVLNTAHKIVLRTLKNGVTSSHLSTTTSASPIAQRKIMVLAVALQQLKYKTSSLLPVAAPQNFSYTCFTGKTKKLLRPSCSLLLTAVPTTSQPSGQRFYTKFTMAAASPIFPKKDFSSAALQAQVDALDDSVDPVQRQLLEEQCIVLNEEDQVIGHDTKRNCHKIVNGDVLLHRAFSVFLFNGKGELLLQQRSKTKITFPMMWTNTCCSHPLYNPSELEEKDSIGVRRAARRRLEIELGIPQDSISLDDFQYLTRIHYKALSDSIWGEHEIDYILFLQKDNLQITPNPDEIEEIRWVTLDKVKEMSITENVALTPWFELIFKSNLPLWWKNLGNLKQFEDHKNIHRM